MFVFTVVVAENRSAADVCSVADVGVVGKDTLLESGADVYELVDLRFAACKLALAGYPGFDVKEARNGLKVATKYGNFARSYYTFYLFNIGRSNFRPVSNEGNFSSVITTADKFNQCNFAPVTPARKRARCV